MRFDYLAYTVAVTSLAACSGPAPNGVLIELAPSVISSIDGTTTVRALVVADRTPVTGSTVHFTVAYTDRAGTAHDITVADGKTDKRGAAEAVVAGLAWEGTGTVTAALDSDPTVTADATFSVLDRTPPTVEILPPTADLHVGPGFRITIQVHAADEIGISQVLFQAAGEADVQRSTLVASGATDVTPDFRLDIPDTAASGPTITIYAMAADLSGNLIAATPIVLIVDPAVAVAPAPGLVGNLLSDGTQSFLDDPRAIALSPMDGKLYVADNSNGAPCNGGCIRQVDPATGNPAAGAVVLVQGQAEGLAFDADGGNLYYSDRPDRIGRLTWNGTGYGTPTVCNVVGNQDPRDPFHLAVDPTLGILVVDGNNGQIKEQPTTCTQDDPTALTDQAFDQPRGIARGAGGEIYVSDGGQNVVRQVDRGTGAVSTFADNLGDPYGLDWLAGGTSAFADTLLIADRQGRDVLSSAGGSNALVAAFRDSPVDVAVDGTTVYVLTQRSFQNSTRGRIFAITGF